MKFSMDDFENVDENTKVAGLFSIDDANFDAVVSKVEGYHPAGDGEKVYNDESDRAYYVLKGSGKIYVAEETYDVEEGDLVYVPVNSGHAVEGELKLLVITSPPFKPENEEVR